MAKAKSKTKSKFAKKFAIRKNLANTIGSKAFYTNDKGIKTPYPMPLMVS